MDSHERFKLVLGSASPRRKELLKKTFLNFEIKSADIDEKSVETIPEKFVVDIANQKAQAVWDLLNNQNAIVIGADTIVTCDNVILEKPTNINHARQMLYSLSGRSHDVLTGVSLISKYAQRSFFSLTKVYFNYLDEDLIEKYLETKDSLDKAGGYGIQSDAMIFVDKIEGSYSNVVGLPVDKVYDELANMIRHFDSSIKDWRSVIE
ncbi:MAG: Maf family protein [Bacteriovoracaceae bacterium]|jgi:MAF protein|nr:Maf family protein [Bacteriovoracaceae bacterium]